MTEGGEPPNSDAQLSRDFALAHAILEVGVVFPRFDAALV